MAGIDTAKFEKFQIESVADLRIWLAQNHTQEASFWMVRFLTTVPDKYVGRLDALDELLCFGWIDGLARKLDGERTMQLISPRRQQAWAQSYKDRLAVLQKEGRMAAPGFAAIERSKQLGLWEAYADVDAFLVPGDLKTAFKAHSRAEAWFSNSAPSYRRNVLRWINAAKTPATREKRLQQTAEMSELGQKIPQM